MAVILMTSFAMTSCGSKASDENSNVSTGASDNVSTSTGTSENISNPISISNPVFTAGLTFANEAGKVVECYVGGYIGTEVDIIIPNC